MLVDVVLFPAVRSELKWMHCWAHLTCMLVYCSTLQCSIC